MSTKLGKFESSMTAIIPFEAAMMGSQSKSISDLLACVPEANINQSDIQTQIVF